MSQQQTSQPPHKGDDLLQRPLYIFNLPEEILYTLTLQNQPAGVSKSPTPEPEPPAKEAVRDEHQEGPATATSCGLCGLKFPTVQDQRSHVRSDLHGYNLKQKLRGRPPVSEVEFEKLVGDLDESISGSDTSSSDSDSEDDREGGQKTKDSTLSALLKKQAKISDPDADDAPKKRKRGSGKAPLVWFKSSALEENVSLGIYRAIFSDAGDEAQLIDTIRTKQLPSIAPSRKAAKEDSGGVPLPGTNIGPHYFLCMIGGGHFAAMIVSLAAKLGKNHTGIDERQATVVAHKTFHRYTTRRKQGGAQSANDSAKGAAHSAGSSLRRYNEAALTDDVRALLKEWKDMIDSAELLFIRATGSTNRRTLFGPYEGQVLRHNEPRNRGFPFSTRRATQAELMRSFVELTRAKVSRVDEAALAAAAAAAAEKESARTPAPTKQAKSQSTPSKEDQVAELHTGQLTSLVRRSKVPGLLSYLSSNSLSGSFPFHPPFSPQHHHAPFPLHLAASTNSPAVILALLTKAGADPTLPNGDGKTAFEIAGDRATRDAFRLARHELGEGKWNWDDAKVPPPLSKAESEKRAQREEAEKKDEATKEKERRAKETERLRKESEQADADARDKKFGKGRTMIQEKTWTEKREEEARGMTPEMRQRLERERRARAVEARLGRLQRR